MRKLILITLTSALVSSNLFGQLNLGAETKTILSPETIIVLDNISLRNQAAPFRSPVTLRFTGNHNETIGGSSALWVKKIIIDKSTAKITLLQEITIDEAIQFNTGYLDLNNHHIALQPGAHIQGENENSHILGSSGGYISITLPLNAPKSINPGNLGAIITSGVNMGSVTIRRGHQAQRIENVPQKSILRYFDIQSSNRSNPNATLRFHYFDSELNNNNEARLHLFRSTNTSNTQWEDLGITSGSTSSNYVEKRNIISLARFTLSELPVTVRPEITMTENPALKINNNNKFILGIYPTVGVDQSLYIRAGNAAVQKMQVRIFDHEGRLIINSQVAYQSQWLPLSYLSHGIYQIVIQSGPLIYSTQFIK
jgi:hypothetical protein